MANIEISSRKVINACDAGVAWIKNYRNEQLAEAIKAEMSKMRFSFREFGKVPRYTSEAEALEAIKKNTDDFFWFSTHYDYIMYAGKETEASLKLLKCMAEKAATITLSAKDYQLIRGYL